MVSKSQIKLITSLGQKKYRDQAGLFIVEGPKIISDLLLSPLQLHSLFTAGFDFDISVPVQSVSERELKKISFLKNPNQALAIFHIPTVDQVHEKGLIVALDEIQDPGNLGTIIRLCDWFGVNQLLCTKNTVDCFNPKVIQASMGSIARVSVLYIDLFNFLENTSLPIFGGFMNAASVYSETLTENAIIVVGNEGNGVSEEIEKIITNKISIPQFGIKKETESLNVATATAILLSEFRRR